MSGKRSRKYGQKVTVIPDGAGGFTLRLQVGRRTFVGETSFTRTRDAKAAGTRVAFRLSREETAAPA